MRKLSVLFAAAAMLLLIGCQGPKIRLFPSAADPLQEFTLQGDATGKVLVIHARGTISNQPRRRLVTTRPSMVQEIVAQLRKAEKDTEIKAVLLKINSPGGSATASDILYHEIMAFKKNNAAGFVQQKYYVIHITNYSQFFSLHRQNVTVAHAVVSRF